MYYFNTTIGPLPITTSIDIPTSVLTLSFGSLSNTMAVVLRTTGTLPTGLTSGTVYYVTASTGTSTFKLATTFANALAGTFITLSGTQTGVSTVSPAGIAVTSLGGASSVPALVNFVMV
jgi:hypothetical protein